jgi:hypothetical protein
MRSSHQIVRTAQPGSRTASATVAPAVRLSSYRTRYWRASLIASEHRLQRFSWRRQRAVNDSVRAPKGLRARVRRQMDQRGLADGRGVGPARPPLGQGGLVDGAVAEGLTTRAAFMRCMDAHSANLSPSTTAASVRSDRDRGGHGWTAESVGRVGVPEASRLSTGLPASGDVVPPAARC